MKRFDTIEETDGHVYDSLAEKDISYFLILFLLFLLHSAHALKIWSHDNKII